MTWGGLRGSERGTMITTQSFQNNLRVDYPLVYVLKGYVAVHRLVYLPG